MNLEKSISLYFGMLFKQFCEAQGLKKTFDDENWINELISCYKKGESEAFMSWIIKNLDLLFQYFEYLNFLDTNLSNKKVMEINKGIFDSLSSCNKNIAVVSQYPVGPDVEKKYQLLDFFESDSNLYPRILTNDGKLFVPNNDIFITHNPYNSLLDLKYWNVIHNQRDYDILVGMFGSTTDLDVKKKIQILSCLQDNMTDDCKLDYDTNNGNYFAILRSDRLTRRLVKSM